MSLPVCIVLLGNMRNEEGRPPSSFLAQQRDAGAGLLVLFHHHTLEFELEEVFHHLFVAWRDFHKVGEHAKGTEPMPVHGDFPAKSRRTLSVL